MTRLELVRYAALLVPCLALWAATRGGPSTRREQGGLLLSGVAALVGLALLHELAQVAGWWSYLDVAGSWRGLPVDLWLGWAVLWGPLPVALRRLVGLPTAVLAAAWLDVVAMPAMTPVVVLGDGWLLGEAVGLAAVLVPAVLLGRWTADRRQLAARTVLQVVVFTGLVFWLLPTTAFASGDGSWAPVTGATYVQLVVLVQVVAVLALPALAAVHELAAVGGGTPFPWDPPDRLVTTGPYAYLANPMQLSATALLGLLAVLTQSWSLGAATVAAVAFSVTVADPHERELLGARFGGAHERYRRQVRPWRVRWRPFVVGPATLHLDGGCALCQQLGQAVVAAGPTDLFRAAAEDHPLQLRRARYEATGVCDDGLPAVARAFERLHLGAAVVGWGVRLPILRTVLQAIADAVGPPRRDRPMAAVPHGEATSRRDTDEVRR